MDYIDFYDLATLKNDDWKGNFSAREIAQNAYDYKVEYDLSIEQGKPTTTMVELCRLLVEDMDFQDYEENESELSLDDMKRILTEMRDSL